MRWGNNARTHALAAHRTMGYVAVLLVSLAGILAGGCGKKPETGNPAASKGKIVEASAISVSVAPAIQKDISDTIEVTGSLAALDDVVVGAKSAGKIMQVYLREGDPVRANQVVAVMDQADYVSQVQSAQANLDAAMTKEQQARAALAQARNQLQNAQTTLQWTEKTTATAVATAQAALQSAQESLSVIKQGARAQERQQAEEAVRSAKANYDKAKADVQRYRDLYRQQVISQSQLDQYEAAYESAQAGYNSAQQALSLIKEGARPEDIRRAELAVQQAREGLTRAQADRAQVAMRREDVNTAKTGIQVAEANIRAAQAGVAQARAALRLAQDALNNTRIISPINGYVAERRAEPGQQVGGGGPILRIVNPSTVYFQAILSESQFARTRVGQQASVTVDALPGRKFAGRVTRILPVASAARSFTVRIDFPADARLRPQMFARGSILIDTHAGATLVPKDALLFDPMTRQARVFVSRPDGKAEERRVSVGYSNTEYVETLSGVHPGEKVIVAGQNVLSNGDPIKVQ
jgi:RND family efflux transporter MFP subunit